MRSYAATTATAVGMKMKKKMRKAWRSFIEFALPFGDGSFVFDVPFYLP
jgi:hypothetical protein